MRPGDHAQQSAATNLCPDTIVQRARCAGIVEPMTIRWLTAVLDVAAGDYKADVRFWSAVTAATAARGGSRPEQSTALVPEVGDAYLAVAPVDSHSGCHLEIHTNDPGRLADKAASLGARLEPSPSALTGLCSPAGLRFHALAWNGQCRRPPPRSWSAGQRSLVDQLCIDVPPEDFDAECNFWAALTGWDHRAGGAGFRYLPRPPDIPLRLLLQRLDDAHSGPARSHLDLACSDVAAESRRHEALGASVAYHGRVWTTLRDVAGIAYCITRRDPDTGTL